MNYECEDQNIRNKIKRTTTHQTQKRGRISNKRKVYAFALSKHVWTPIAKKAHE